MKPLSEKNVRELEERIGYTFQNPELLHQALCHASVVKIKKVSPFERLEFVGDSVLGFVIAHYLFELYPDETEGMLSARRSALVRRSTLFAVAKTLELNRILLFDQQAEGARFFEKIIADGCEALLGALFLDGGLENVEKCVKNWWQPFIKAQNAPPVNAKSFLQEWAQAKGFSIPYYRLIEKSGSAHAPLFKVRVEIGHYRPIEAAGVSKKKAETAAAELFLSMLEEDQNLLLREKNDVSRSCESDES